MDYQVFIDLLTKGNRNEGFEMLFRCMFSETARLISGKTGITDKHELLGIFYDGFEYFFSKFKSGNFVSRDFDAFRNYFKTGCLNKAREYQRFIRGPVTLVNFETVEKYNTEFEEAIEETRREEYARIENQYHIKMDEIEPEFDLYKEAVKAFHTLGDKCKFLIVLKHFIKLSHRQIVDGLNMFFEIKNENVSKTELQRCIDKLREKTRTNPELSKS